MDIYDKIATKNIGKDISIKRRHRLKHKKYIEEIEYKAINEMINNEISI
jgi:hypothetical protein